MVASKAVDSASELAQALAALKAADRATALRHVLALWQAFKWPELRSLAVALGSAEAPFKYEVGVRSLVLAKERLDGLQPLAADPRTTAVIEAVLLSAPWTSDASKPVWEALFKVVAASGDAQYLVLHGGYADQLKVRARFLDFLLDGLGEAVKQLKPASAASLACPPAEKALLAQLVERAKAGTEKRDRAGLFAAVYAQPDRDEPRLVLADAMQEAGEVRGEFISLQCRSSLSAAETRRRNQLRKVNCGLWLDALYPVLTSPAKTVFRRGFASEGTVRFRHEQDVRTFGANPAWATFEALTWVTPSTPATDQLPFVRFIGPAFRHLRVAKGPWVPHLLAANEPWSKLESLEVELTAPSQLAELVLHRASLFPRLRELTVTNPLSPSALNAFKGSAKWPTVRALAFTSSQRGYEAQWRALLDAAGVKAAPLEPEHAPAPGRDDAHQGLAFAATGSSLFLALGERVVELDPRSRETLREWPARQAQRLHALRRSHRLLLASHSALQVLDLTTGALVTDVFSSFDTSHVVISPDERFASFESTAGRPAVVDLELGAVCAGPEKSKDALWVNSTREWWVGRGRSAPGYHRFSAGAGKPMALVDCDTVTDFTVDEAAMTFTARTPSTVTRWSLTDGRVLRSAPLEAQATGFGYLAVSADGRRLATTVGRGSVQVFDAVGLRPLHSFSIPDAHFRMLAVSADGTQVAASDGTTLHVFDARA